MNITIWTSFSKRRNSTKQPVTAGTIVSVVLKEETNENAPSFILNNSYGKIVYCQAFGNYYFVKEPIHLDKDHIQIDCEKDVLASFKSDITGSTQYIAYASSGYNVNIIDPRLSVLTTKTVDLESEEMPYLNTTGSYILAVAGLLSDGEYGMATYYICNSAVLKSIAETLFLINGGPLDNLVKQLKSLYDGIISCTWVPFDYTELTTGAGAIGIISDIYIGDTRLVDGGGSAIRAVRVNTNTVKAVGKYISIPWAHSDFRDSAPYTTASLFIPMYGNVDININDLIGNTSLGVYSSLDLITGDITIVLTGGQTGAFIKTINYNVGVACPIAQTSNNMLSVLASIGGTAAGAIGLIGGITAGSAGAAVGGAMAALAGGTNTVLNYQSRSISVKGSLSGRSFIRYGTNYILTLYLQDTQNPDDASYISKCGRPVMKAESLSGHTGYIECINASIDISADPEERDSINSFLNGGMYIE